MSSPSKAKGNRFERLVVNKASEAGLSSKRAYASNGMSLGLAEDVDCLVGGYKVQCKTRARIAKWIKVPESCDVTAVKEDRGDTYIVIRYEDWLELINLIDKKGKRQMDNNEKVKEINSLDLNDMKTLFSTYLANTKKFINQPHEKGERRNLFPFIYLR